MLSNRQIGILMLFFALHLGAKAADTAQTKQFLSVQSSFFQIKDEFNYGLVTNGTKLGLDYAVEKYYNNSLLSYSGGLAFGLGKRMGVALNVQVKPFDIHYGFKIQEAQSIYLGVYTAGNYQWQLYPELQSGHMFWFSSCEFGARAQARINAGNHQLQLRVSNSLAGFSSRPLPATEEYFYSLNFSDFIGNPHSNIKFGSFSVLNHTNLQLELLPRADKRTSLIYEFDYRSQYQASKVEYLSHSLKIKWIIGNPNK